MFSTTAATLTAYAAKRKKTVYILSSVHSVIQTDNTTKRKPNTVTLYNTTKCGVDVMDQMVREYTVRTGTRRWPVAVFYNMIDMAALNAHVLYQACTGRQERRVDFLVELARELANSHMCAKKARKEQLLRTQPSTPSPGKRAMCQVKHQCKNNHATVQCVHCYRYTCGKCRREIPWQCQDCEWLLECTHSLFNIICKYVYKWLVSFLFYFVLFLSINLSNKGQKKHVCWFLPKMAKWNTSFLEVAQHGPTLFT